MTENDSDFPRTLRRKGQEVKIYRGRDSRSNSNYFTVVYYAGQSRRRATRRTIEEAQKLGEDVLETLCRNHVPTSLSMEDWELLKKLKKVARNRSPWRLLEDVQSAAKVLNEQVSLSEAAEFWKSRHSHRSQITVGEAFETYLRALEAQAAERHLRDVRNRLSKFEQAFRDHAMTDISRQAIRLFLEGFKVSSRTRNNFRAQIITFFRWAQKQGHLEEGRMTEAEFIDPWKLVEKEVEIFTLQQIRALFRGLRSDLEAYAAIAAFAGLRPSEIQRLTWGDIDFNANHIYISPQVDALEPTLSWTWEVQYAVTAYDRSAGHQGEGATFIDWPESVSYSTSNSCSSVLSVRSDDWRVWFPRGVMFWYDAEYMHQTLEQLRASAPEAFAKHTQFANPTARGGWYNLRHNFPLEYVAQSSKLASDEGVVSLDGGGFAEAATVRIRLKQGVPAGASPFRLRVLQTTERGGIGEPGVPASPVPVELVVGPGESTSNSINVYPMWEEGYRNAVRLDPPLPVDLDIVHPVTGELAESKEDSDNWAPSPDTGGLVALRRDENTPMTGLLIHAVSSAPSGSKARINVMDSDSQHGTVKVWRDPSRSQEVTSTAEFDASTDTTLYLEGVDVTAQWDIRIQEQLRFAGQSSWIDGDQVSVKVVEAEIPVILRAYIPHLWTSGEGPIPMQGTVLLVFPFFVPTAFSNTVGGDRTPPPGYSLDPDNPTYRLTQRVWLCPFKELHSNAERSDKRYPSGGKAADFSHYYVRDEDVPAADQSKDFGEVLIGGWNWRFAPASPTTHFTEPTQDDNGCSLKVDMSGGAGMPWFVPDGAVPNIDWDATLTVDVSNPIRPKIRAVFTNNLYPAYEVMAADSKDDYHAIHKYVPPAVVLPGPHSLNNSETTRTAWVELP